MKNLQKMGGYAALIHSGAYMVGIGLYFSILSPIIDANTSQYLAQLAGYKSIMYIWIMICYLLAGVCMVPVSIALYDRLKVDSPALAKISTALGLIWACLIIASGNLMTYGFGQISDLYNKNPDQAETVLTVLKIVENGIISGNELTGGLWILLVSWAALQTGLINKTLNYFGVMIGVAGLLTLIPAISELSQNFFGMSMIVWFAWLGIILLRRSSSKTL